MRLPAPGYGVREPEKPQPHQATRGAAGRLVLNVFAAKNEAERQALAELMDAQVTEAHVDVKA